MNQNLYEKRAIYIQMHSGGDVTFYLHFFVLMPRGVWEGKCQKQLTQIIVICVCGVCRTLHHSPV